MSSHDFNYKHKKFYLKLPVHILLQSKYTPTNYITLYRNMYNLSVLREASNLQSYVFWYFLLQLNRDD